MQEVNVQHLHQDHNICDASLGNHLHIFLKISSLLPESEDPRSKVRVEQNPIRQSSEPTCSLEERTGRECCATRGEAGSANQCGTDQAEEEFNIVIIVISVFVNMEERQVEPINVELSPWASASQQHCQYSQDTWSFGRGGRFSTFSSSLESKSPIISLRDLTLCFCKEEVFVGFRTLFKVIPFSSSWGFEIKFVLPLGRV